MQQFFIDDISKPKLSKQQIHQVKTVLKMRVGDTVRLVDFNCAGVIVSFVSPDFKVFNIIEPIEFKKKNTKLKIVASLIRSERLEWMIQKAAEAGVDEIVLYSADKGVVKDYGEKIDRKISRFNLIALEASEQSYRQVPLKVRGVIGKYDIEKEKGDINLFADTQKYKHYLDEITLNKDISVIVGPEGGFSDHERETFTKFGFKPVSLGANIYRAETAPVAIAVLTTSIDREII